MYYALGNTEINKYSMQKSNMNKYKLILLLTNSIFIRVETTQVEHIFGTDPLRSNTYSERTHPHSDFPSTTSLTFEYGRHPMSYGLMTKSKPKSAFLFRNMIKINFYQTKIFYNYSYK